MRAGKAVAGGPAEVAVGTQVPHSWAEKPGGTTGEQDRPRRPGFYRQEIKPQTSD